MKKLLTIGSTLAVPALLGCWACAFAQSLGTPAATAWIGRPLEMTVPARFASGEARDDCVHADVFYGENRLRRDQVRTSVIGGEDARRVRIEVAATIDEPIVTVSVRAGCSNTITRNYTLLPEMPSEQMLAGIVRPAAQATPAAHAAANALGAAATPAPLRMSGLGSARAPAVRPALAMRDDRMPRARMTRSLRATDSIGSPRLKLEPFEPDRQTLLRVSATLSDPMGDVGRRATAALLWQAINADPTELLRTTAMIQKLEGDLASLRQSASQTRAEMAALRRRVEDIGPWYASAAALQVLALLVLVAAAAAGTVWYRTRRAGRSMDPWYSPSPDSVLDSQLDPTLDARDEPARTAAAPEPSRPQPQPHRVPASQPRPAPLVVEPSIVFEFPRAPAEISAPVVPRVVSAPAAVPAQRGPIAFEVPLQADKPRRSTPRGVLRVETLAATFEEVEFLSSLGVPADAMDVLKSYLEATANPAPLAFFELMRLSESEGDQAAIAAVRRRYTQVYGLEPPTVEQLTAPLSLDSLPDLSARITAAWGRRVALDIIEQALFSVPAPGAALTLQAGRDLICLYDVAMTLVAEGAGGAAVPNGEPEPHPLAPWANADDPGGALMAIEAAGEARADAHFGLDFDLDTPAEPESDNPFAHLQLEPLPDVLPATASREDDAFSAAMASERSRY
ncbi:MAG: Fe-S oxidoreductase [Ramlibacter sp.]|nr:Fe-S oxidoreductase [Ramlibacter sp.]